MHSYFEIGLKPAVFCCLTNCITPLLIALESCSSPQTNRQVYLFAVQKKVLVLGFGFFVSDVISEGVFWPFWLILPGLGPNRYTDVFR